MDFELNYTIFNLQKSNVFTVKSSHMGLYFAHRQRRSNGKYSTFMASKAIFFLSETKLAKRVCLNFNFCFVLQAPLGSETCVICITKKITSIFACLTLVTSQNSSYFNVFLLVKFLHFMEILLLFSILLSKGSMILQEQPGTTQGQQVTKQTRK